MKVSKYNIWAEHLDKLYVYNGLTGSLLQTNHELRERLEKGDVPDPPPKGLHDAGVIVDDDKDELSILEARYNYGRTARTKLALTILSSLGCNFDCPYCYEAKRPEVLTPEIEEAILRFIEDRIQSGVDAIAVQWLGGEPLLGRKSILNLSREIKSKCDPRHISYMSYITTNGYLLTPGVANELVKAGVMRAQITLDGPPAIHDKMRPGKNGEPTFWRILTNIQSVVDIIPVVVRINVDKENFSHIEELLAILDDAGVKEKIEVYVGHLVPVDDGVNQPSATYKASCFNTKEFSETERYFNEAATRRGFKSRVLDGPILTPCMAMREEEYVIGTRGELYKCWKSVGNRNEVVGNIVDYKNINSRVRRWLSYTPFEDDECRACIALPVCMGGCAHHAFDKRLFEDRCITFRYEHRERVIQFIQQVHRFSETRRRKIMLSVIDEKTE
jgi:uncharacterized protein